jgi:hypothetical protein
MRDGEEVKKQPFRFADPRQAKIYERLKLIGDAPAAFYLDACRLLNEQPQYASTSHLVGHLLREIDGSLRDVLESGSDQKVTGEQDRHKQSISIVLGALEISEADPIAVEWLRLAGRNNDSSLHRWAHRSALSAVRPVDAEFMELWNRMQVIFDVVLGTFENRFLLWAQKAERLAQKEHPSREDVKRLRGNLPNNRAALGGFYDKLRSPTWLAPLAAEGEFQNPPAPIRDPEKATVGYSIWPQSRYLARMASIAPDEVFHIIESVPETQNFLVHIDFANAVCDMPPAAAAKLLPKMKAWIESGEGSVTDKLGQLMESLAEAGEHDAALILARMLLEIGTRDQKGRLGQQGGVWLWHYERTLLKYSRVVTEVGEPALTVLCDLLDKTIDDSRFVTDKLRYEDNSTNWCPAIEMPPHVAIDIKPHLVSGIRDAATTLAQKDSTIVPHLVKALRKRRKVIFRRLAHLLLHSFPDADRAAIEQTLLSRGMLLKANRWHEYSLLMHDCFKLLSPKDQEKILTWVDKGPDRKPLMRRYERFYGQPAQPERIERAVTEWKKEHVGLVSADLPPRWKEKFAEFLTPLSPEQQLDNVAQVSGGAWVRHKSPDEARNFATQTVDAIIEFLKTWKPSGDWMAPTVEGLASDLQNEVKNSPARFAAEAAKFQALQPVYIGALADGLQEAVRNGATFDWKPVIELSRWAVNQPTSKFGTYPSRDGSWYWTRASIARLFSAGFDPTAATIPFDLRYDVWAVVDRLIHPSPISEKPAESVSDDQTAATSSPDRQTVSPEPLLAVIRYALWSARMLQTQTSEAEKDQRWLDKVPEVGFVLSEQLKPENSPVTSAHTVVGEQLGRLFDLDREWFSKHLSDIFPDSAADRLGERAWVNYLFAWNPGAEIFECLRPCYLRAIERINEAPPKTQFPQDSNERLADHLMLMYWRGNLALDDELLRAFFANASDKIRSHALHQVGFSVHSSQTKLESQVNDRLKALFEARLKAVKSGDAAQYKTELAAFGWWFESAQFDVKWSMTTLLEVLTLVGKVEVAHLVVERLAELSVQMPEECAKSISLLCDGLTGSDLFEIQGWEKHQRTVLNNAIQSGNPRSKEEAIALINRLASRGYSAFADLIPPAAAS